MRRQTEYVKIRKRRNYTGHKRWLHGAGRCWHFMKTNEESTICGLEVPAFERRAELEIYKVITSLGPAVALCQDCIMGRVKL